MIDTRTLVTTGPNTVALVPDYAASRRYADDLCQRIRVAAPRRPFLKRLFERVAR